MGRARAHRPAWGRWRERLAPAGRDVGRGGVPRSAHRRAGGVGK